MKLLHRSVRMSLCQRISLGIIKCWIHIFYTFSSRPRAILGKRGTMNKIAEVNDHFKRSLEYRQTLKTFLIVVLVKDV